MIKSWCDEPSFYMASAVDQETLWDNQAKEGDWQTVDWDTQAEL